MLVSAIALGLGGCASLPPMPNSAREQLDFMAQVLSATPAAREATWQQLRSAANTERNELRIGLMQSVPGHSGYDPVAAQRRLHGFVSRTTSPELASVARVRLAEIAAASSCREEVLDLRRRMTMMVDIEKRQEQ